MIDLITAIAAVGKLRLEAELREVGRRAQEALVELRASFDNLRETKRVLRARADFYEQQLAGERAARQAAESSRDFYKSHWEDLKAQAEAQIADRPALLKKKRDF